MMSELSVEKLRRVCDPAKLSCQSSAEMEVLETIIGQERAVRALQFGLGIQEKGFNIYVSGMPGTGRTTAVERFLEDVARDKPVPWDWCYVNSLRDLYRPEALSLPPGKALVFQADMKRLVEEVQREIRRAFESDEYNAHREERVRSFQQQRDDLIAAVNDQAEREGFVIQASPVGLLTIPVRDGNPLTEEEFAALSTAEKEEISQKRSKLQAALEAALRQARTIERGAGEELEKLDHEVALYAIRPLVEDIKKKYPDLPKVLLYLERFQADVLENLSQFKDQQAEKQEAPVPMFGRRRPNLAKYDVNVIVDNSALKGAPVIIELNPTYNNLFGRIEQEAQFGALVTDFTMIRGGALHQANGGYLVMHVEDLLRNPFAWESLKRALENQEIAIEDIAERLGMIATKSLRPEPIPLRVKVILIGRPDIYQLLRAYDEDVSELFKVRADFDTRMPRDEENANAYAAFVCTVCEEGKLAHLDSSALAKMIEYGSRMAEDQTKLSTRFGELADVIREASYYAAQEGVQFATGAHVKRAIEERFYRSSLVQERIREMIERGSIMIDVEGACVGQVNGLSVVGLGDIAFGQPSRITVSLGLGREGVMDIEREAKLGGPIHTKGVLILSGFLAEKFAQDKPLSLSARVVFEQSYGGVEGDSASSTELYAILSSLSGLPIQQGIAVTGSVNQKGHVQAIGGVNEKIEGFFAVCQAKGLSGTQGVMIPASNVQNLMLKEEVVEAVREGRFRIWAVETIDQGIEILTGVKGGERREDGTYEEGTVNARVEARLKELAEAMRSFARSEGAGGAERESPEAA
jgi:lon-related putative ATP-dependent protease